MRHVVKISLVASQTQVQTDCCIGDVSGTCEMIKYNPGKATLINISMSLKTAAVYDTTTLESYRGQSCYLSLR